MEKKRKLVPQPNQRVILVDRAEGIQNTLNTALAIVSEQLQKLALKSKASTFTDQESRVLQSYIKSLVDLSKEEREREKSDIELDKLKNLSDAELLELANQHLNTAKTVIDQK